MKTELLQAVSIAGMLHDIGKFAERADAVASGDPDIVQQEYRYDHGFHTEQALKLLFPEEQLSKKFGDSAEYTVLNLAARHHNPRNVLELLIAEADRIASGHERVEGDENSDYDTGGRERKSKTPMLSIMARIRLKKHAARQEDAGDRRYRINNEGLAYASDEFDRLFPVSSDEYGPEEVRRDYRNHWQAFRRSIGADNGLGLDLFGQTSTIFDVCRTFLWCLPASTRKEEMPDVSLFDHQKATAALAASLYWYHAENDSLLEAAITDRSQDKFLLFCGDISGIQRFIYRLSSKGAYKTLKGRSFFIQLLSELLADNFVQALGLTRANILYASGGKFYLLLPNTTAAQDILSALQEEVNAELLERFSGDIFVRFSRVPLSGSDLTRQSGRTLCQIWDELTRRLVAEDTRRYAATVSQNYDRLFGIADGNQGSCIVCHCSMPKGNESCRTCNEMKALGGSLAGAGCVAISTEPLEALGRPSVQIFGRFIYLLPGNNLAGLNAGKSRLYALNNPDFAALALDRARNGALVDCTPFLAGSLHAFADTFDEIANQSRGVKRLGILRMDVDSLGKIFSEGLQNYSHEKIRDKRFHSLGRITTLSWQLTLFFSGMLPQLIVRNPDWRDRVTVVYSGGDDLFLVGAWDALPEIALEIQQRFAAFTCDNPSCTLSGGLALTDGKFPIYKSADMAGEAEHRAKKNETTLNGSRVDKASLTFFETPMHWQEFEILSRLHSKLHEVAADSRNTSLLRHLSDIAASWRESKAMLERHGSLSMEAIKTQLEAEKWRWGMVYALSRYAKERPALAGYIQELQHFITSPVGETKRQGIELLGVLTRWCELRLRNEKRKETE